MILYFRFFLKKSVNMVAHSVSSMPFVVVVAECKGDEEFSEKPRLTSVAP